MHTHVVRVIYPTMLQATMQVPLSHDQAPTMLFFGNTYLPSYLLLQATNPLSTHILLSSTFRHLQHHRFSFDTVTAPASLLDLPQPLKLAQDEHHPRHHRPPPRHLRPRNPLLHLPRHRPNNPRRIPPSRRLPRLQIPHLVMERRRHTHPTGRLPTRWKTVPRHTWCPMPSTTRTAFRGQCGR